MFILSFIDIEGSINNLVVSNIVDSLKEYVIKIHSEDLTWHHIDNTWLSDEIKTDDNNPDICSYYIINYIDYVS